ncbi:MAG: ester cyclase [Burkholderiales bacterium]|nr:ester cyclase [Burkholderiales bacterium]
MFSTPMKAVLLALASAWPYQMAFADTPAEILPEPHHISMTTADPAAISVLTAARRYAAFWHTGDAHFVAEALAPDFYDRTLPAGRPQGTAGPLEASRGFRAAVPDLTAEIDDIVIAGDRAAVHLHFRGHFTGKFGEQAGQGQTVDFQAFDLYRVVDGRIAENWHLEDNLTVLKQLGAIKP